MSTRWPRIVVTMLCGVLAVAASTSADITMSTNTTAQRFSTLTMEEKLSYLDAVMDTLSIDHAVNVREWVCPKQHGGLSLADRKGHLDILNR